MRPVGSLPGVLRGSGLLQVDFLVMNTKEKQYSWLAGLLTGWGIKESWAKLIAGAIIGALAAAGLLTSCGGAPTAEQLDLLGAVYEAYTGKVPEYRVIKVKEVQK